jgi:hypothetical protein
MGMIFFHGGLSQGPFHNGKHAKFVDYASVGIDKNIFGKFVNRVKKDHPSGLISYSQYDIKNIPILEDVFKDNKNFDNQGNFYFNTGNKGKNLIAGGTGGETIFWKEKK